MEKEANTLSNYFRTDCPLTFHNITEIHPFWDRDLLWLQISKRWQHPMLCWLAASLQTAHSRGLIIASPESQFAREGGWRGDMAFCISVLPESSGNSCMDCFKWIWKGPPPLFLFLKSSALCDIFLWGPHAYPYVFSGLLPEGGRVSIARDPLRPHFQLPVLVFYKHREVRLTCHHQPFYFFFFEHICVQNT